MVLLSAQGTRVFRDSFERLRLAGDGFDTETASLNDSFCRSYWMRGSGLRPKRLDGAGLRFTILKITKPRSSRFKRDDFREGDPYRSLCRRSVGVRFRPFWYTVPCSFFGPLLIELEHRAALTYQVASVEAEAVAMAAGAVLGGRTPLVMIQNSGLGNCVNPISSLLEPFGVPLTFLVSHRGAGKDAPQHEMMGRVTYPLLELLEVDAQEFPLTLEAALESLGDARVRTKTTGRSQGFRSDRKALSRQRRGADGEPRMPDTTRRHAVALRGAEFRDVGGGEHGNGQSRLEHDGRPRCQLLYGWLYGVGRLDRSGVWAGATDKTVGRRRR